MSGLSVMVVFNGHKSLLTYGGVSMSIHDGEYAVDIKSKTIPVFLINNQEAYDIASKIFFDVVDQVTNIYGYNGFSIEGRNGRWLKPLIEINGSFKAIKADLDEYISFNEKIVQHRFESYATKIIGIKEDIELVYANSKTIDEMIDTLNRMYER